MSNLKIYSDQEALISAAAEFFIDLGNHSIDERERFVVALAGGGTPAPLYALLGAPENRQRLDWPEIHLFWGDERPVPPACSESNYRMVKEQLLDAVTIPENNIHRVPAEMDVRIAAFSYEEELRGFFDGEWPQFDLVLLGMGDDGHTASLFPHSAGLNEEDRWFIANFAPAQKTWRLTLTKNAINTAHNIVVLVSGKAKAKTLAKVLEGDHDPENLPIQLISPTEGEMIWLLDKEAASELNSNR